MSQKGLLIRQFQAVGHHLLPVATIRALWQHRELIHQLTWREVHMRYRGSFLGMLWAFLRPLATLTVYTVVFSVILKARWGTDVQESHVRFALTMFAGLIAFDIFSEILQKAALMVPQNVGYVKKVIFPLEVLPVAHLGCSLVHMGIGLAILVLGLLVLTHTVAWTIIFFPLVLLPLVMLTLGLAWFVASLGVFLRDVDQALTVIMQLMFFITPIFYPIERVPESLRWMIYINPMALLVEQARRTLVWSQPPDWLPWLAVTAVSLVVMQLGFAWFMETKRGFADVL